MGIAYTYYCIYYKFVGDTEERKERELYTDTSAAEDIFNTFVEKVDKTKCLYARLTQEKRDDSYPVTYTLDRQEWINAKLYTNYYCLKYKYIDGVEEIGYLYTIDDADRAKQCFDYHINKFHTKKYCAHVSLCYYSKVNGAQYPVCNVIEEWTNNELHIESTEL